MNIFYVAGIPYSDELYHHGIKGQKWGVRRFQNLDGTRTAAGKERYYNSILGSSRKIKKTLNKIDQKQAEATVKMNKVAAKQDKLGEKLLKRMDQGNTKTPGLERKIESTRNKLTKLHDRIENYKTMSNEIIGKATDLGYTVKSKEVVRSVGRGKKIAAGVLGVIGAATIAAVGFPEAGVTFYGSNFVGYGVASPLAAIPASKAVRTNKVRGTKYTVRNSSKYKDARQ